ncbi:MAG: RHS repeat-associated core domain-containing protein [Pseudomonadota bacterium]
MIFFFISFYAYSQKDKEPNDPKKPKDPKDSINFIARTVQEENILVRQSSQSPTAAGLGKYVDLPVNYNSGLPQISIPITTVSGKQLNLPISLSYHGGGIKVSELASWVGLNWSLNAGGVITRQINGGPDEGYLGGNKGTTPIAPNPANSTISSGWYKDNGFAPFLLFQYSGPVPDKTYPYPAASMEKVNPILSAAVGAKDTEPDIFNFNVAGKYGKFYFDQNRNPHFFPNQDIKVEVNFDNTADQFISFTLITDEGTKYYFGGTAFEISTSTLGRNAVITGSKLKTSWYLFKIESADGQDIITLDYTNEGTKFHNLRSEQAQTSSFSKYQADPLITPFLTNTGIEGRRLNKITSSKVEVSFNANTEREDVSSHTVSGISMDSPKRLDEILIKSIEIPTSGIKFKLSYDYYSSLNPISGTFENELKTAMGNNVIDNVDTKRLRLTSIQELSSDESVSKPSYQFTYEPTLLPRRISFQRDHGGYYNGQSNNKSLIDHEYVTPRPNRASDWAYMKAGHLKEIIWPTGGSTEYVYDAPCTNCLNGAGLRIKEIKSKISGSTVNSKSFEFLIGTTPLQANNYGTQINTNAYIPGDWKDFCVNNDWPTSETPPYLFIPNCYGTNPNSTGTTNPVSYGETYISSDLYSELKSILGQSISYGSVKEIFPNNGYSIFTYPNPNLNYFITQFPFVGNLYNMYYFVNQGKLLSEAHYNQSNSKIKEIFYDYFNKTVEDQTTDSQKAYKFQSTGCDASKVHISKYFLPKNLRSILLTKTEKEYDQNGANEIVTTTNFVYGTNHEQPIITSFNKSNGDVSVTETKYIKDFVTGSSNSGAAAKIKDLKDRNINPPIETLTFVKKNGETNANMKAISGKITVFDTYASNSNNIKPKEIYTLKVGNDPITVTRSTISNNSFTYDANYEKRAEFTYNSAGLLATEKLTNSSTTSYNYSSYGQLTSKIEASGTSIALTTSYDNNTLFGVTKITSPNNLKKTFEYDKLGRLVFIKNDNHEIEKAYSYTIGSSNKIKEINLRTPKAVAQFDFSNLTHSDNTISNKYFDGLGRPLQNVIYHASGDATKDIITDGIAYDPLGRPFKNYINFFNQGDGNLATLPTDVSSDSRPFTEITSFDTSPFNRPIEIYGPGDVWKNNTKAIVNTYGHKPGGTMRLYQVTSTGFNGTSNYPLTITKTSSKSEKGGTINEYKDNEGRTLFKEGDLDGTTGVTSYIYDDVNRLKYVLQPMGFAQSSQTFTDSDLKYAFAYRYDTRGRVTEKHVPGGGWTSMIYDISDRLVMSQTALQASEKKWSYIKYDALGRDIENGEFTFSTNPARSTLQSSFTSQTNAEAYPAISNITNTSQRILKSYDSQSGITAGGYAGVNEHTTYTGLLTNIRVRNKEDNGYYDNKFFYDNRGRVIQTVNGHHLSNTNNNVTYYKYNFTNDLVNKKTVHYNGTTTTTDELYNEYDHMSRLKKSFQSINGSEFNQLAENTYDDFGRLSKTLIKPGTTNYICGNGSGQVLSTSSGQWFTSGTWNNNTVPSTSTNANIQVGHTVTMSSGQTGNAAKVDNYGTLRLTPNSNLTLSGNAAGSGSNTSLTNLQTIDYTYHIRGWLTGINPTVSGSEADLFGYNLEYDYDGNISKSTWSSPKTLTGCDMVTRTYDYTYDAANRLKMGTFSGGLANENYSLTYMEYDYNGNIKKLERNGKQGSGYGQIDKLEYSYTGNILNSITDNAATNSNIVDFKPAPNTITSAYTYNLNGALTGDTGEKISLITYDSFINQPKVLTTDGRTITNEYDGSGKLLNTTYSTGEAWHYDDGLIYKKEAGSNDVKPYQLSSPEGRVAYTNNTWNYEYAYKDHLGNTRLSFAKENGGLVVKDIADFDPWGIQLQTGSYAGPDNRWRLQGKEKESTFGLNRISFGARTYNPTIGRFDSVDPLAKNHLNESVYSYAGNNPVLNIDPDGQDWYEYNENAIWRSGNDKEYKSESGDIYKNVGANYTMTFGNTSYSYEQNSMTNISEKVLDNDQFQTQFDTRFGDKSRQNVACKRACEVMLSNDGLASAGRNDATQQVGRETANGVTPTANLERGNNVLNNEVEARGNPIIVGVDRGVTKPYNDKTTDHFIVVSGVNYDLKNHSTSFNYFDPGRASAINGTSRTNILSRNTNGLLQNVNKNRTYIVTNVRPNLR